DKTGVFTGRHVTNPATGEQIPVWVADYVLMAYRTGAIMAVPAHDERDFAFAELHDLPVRVVLRAPDAEVEDGVYVPHAPGEALVASGDFTGLSSEEGKS